MNTADILETARQMHHAGHLGKAEQGYREALQGEPANPDALHLLGVIALQQGRFDEAVQSIGRALESRPIFPQALNNRGAALREIGRTEEAVASFRRAGELDPQFADAFYNLGTSLYLMSRTEEAIEALQRAVVLEPGMQEGHLNLGTALRSVERYDESDEALRRALAINPDFAEAYCNLGANESARGRYDSAIGHLRKAIELRPEFCDAWYNLANALLEKEAYDESVAAYRHCLTLRPEFAMANAKLVEALARKGDTEAAEATYREGLELVLSVPESAYEVGVTRLKRGDAGGALQAADRSLAVRPAYTRGLSLRAIALTELGERAAAEELLGFGRLVRVVDVGPEPGVTDVAALNAALTEHVLQHPTLSSDPEGHATKHGQHTGELLMEPKGPVAILERVIDAQVHAYRDWVRAQSGHPFLVGAPERLGLTAWGVVIRAQGHQIPHNHPAAWLSGVYYAKVPPVVSAPGETQAGWLEFGRPPDNFNCRADHPVHALQPREGRLVLFPSYLYHRTVPYQADELRISIAFDAVPLA